MNEPNFSKMSKQELRAYNIKSRRNHMKDMCTMLNENKSFVNNIMAQFITLEQNEPEEVIKRIYNKLISDCESQIEELESGIEENCKEYSNAEVGNMVNRNAPSDEELQRLMANSRAGVGLRKRKRMTRKLRK
jgi:HPt (histidine-containing phosphotransfer) domain-containing protein